MYDFNLYVSEDLTQEQNSECCKDLINNKNIHRHRLKKSPN